MLDNTESHLHAQLHRYMTGSTMFCRSCDSILDYRSSVYIESQDHSAMVCHKCATKLTHKAAGYKVSDHRTRPIEVITVPEPGVYCADTLRKVGYRVSASEVVFTSTDFTRVLETKTRALLRLETLTSEYNPTTCPRYKRMPRGFTTDSGYAYLTKVPVRSAVYRTDDGFRVVALQRKPKAS